MEESMVSPFKAQPAPLHGKRKEALRILGWKEKGNRAQPRAKMIDVFRWVVSAEN